MQTLIAILSALTTAAYFVYASQVMKNRPDLSSGVTLAVSHLVAAAALFVPWLFFYTPSFQALATPEASLLLLMAAGLLVISRKLYFYAYANTDVANITVFSALTPVYTLATGFILLNEIPSPLSLAGLLLICGSIYALFLKRDPAKSWLQNIVQPFCHIGSSTPILCAFLSTIPTAFAATFQKKLMTSLDAVTFSLFLLLAIGILALVISLVQLKPGEILRQMRRLPWGFVIASALLLPLTHVLFCLVIREHLTAVSLVLQRCSIVFQIIFAYYFLRERSHIGKRLVVGASIMLGFILVISGS